MKRIIALVIFSLFVSAANAQNKTATITIKSSIYCDHCKTCESCGSRLEKAVFALKGIKRVDIDEKQKTLVVVYNPQKTTADNIKQAIVKVGFDADDLKADPAAYTELDGCCKKSE